MRVTQLQHLHVIPASVKHTRTALESSPVNPRIDDELGRLVRGLSATRHGGVSLVSGSGACDLAGWIIDGMDMTCRLVVHHEADVDASVVKSAFNNDLRVTTHQQPFIEFLDDVNSHQFAIVVMAPPILTLENLRRVTQAVGDGGALVLQEPDVSALGNLDGLSEFCLLHESDSAIVVVKRPESNRPYRRGGRRRGRE